MLMTTEGVEKFLSGVIMFDETVRQETDDGLGFTYYLEKKGITPGIKVDEGREPFGEEEVAKGLSGLAERLKQYNQLGLKFTKWRAPIKITEVFPSREMIVENSRRMAEFAEISQQEGFVPIVEPEVTIDGNHTTARCEEVTVLVLKTLFGEILNREISLGGLLLKTNMVLPGKDSGISADPLEVAEATLRVLKASVPPGLPGIVFLSGGQSPQEATVNLNEINVRKGNAPWQLSFSFARALQVEALEVWQGKESNVKMAQEAFYRRAKNVSFARQGKYQPSMEEG
jgi:fructose-bisphosphate aldolase class I